MIDVDFRALGGRLGQELAVSEWLEITQERIDRFAEATEDRQWIHIDPVRASVESPYKATIAHGFLTLSLVSVLARTAMSFPARMAINYGLNKVRFVAPVPVGSRVRARFVPGALLDIKEHGAVQVTWHVTIEREGGDRPCAVAEWLVRYYIGA